MPLFFNFLIKPRTKARVATASVMLVALLRRNPTRRDCCVVQFNPEASRNTNRVTLIAAGGIWVCRRLGGYPNERQSLPSSSVFLASNSSDEMMPSSLSFASLRIWSGISGEGGAEGGLGLRADDANSRIRAENFWTSSNNAFSSWITESHMGFEDVDAGEPHRGHAAALSLICCPHSVQEMSAIKHPP